MPLNKGTFIISLDCEGKWGMADHIGQYHETHFTNANIKRAYAQILRILKEYDVPASFAFVGAFTQSVAQFKQHRDVFYNTPQSYKAWLKKFYHDMENQHHEGWFCPAPLALVAEDGRHEIGSHSFFHRAFSESELTQQDAEYDFRITQELFPHKVDTFIYPRNVVGFTELLKKYDYLGYRHGNPYAANPLGRLRNLAAEFNITTPSEPPLTRGVVPAGYFLNWPHGLRKYVPSSITQLRWNNILNHAVKHNGVAHLWFHPHNFINHPEMVKNFRNIVATAAHHRNKDQLTIMTMRDYCRAL